MITFSSRAIKNIRLLGILYLTLPIFVLYTTCFSWPFAILFDSLYALMLFWCRKTFFAEKEVSVPVSSLISLIFFVVILLLISGVGALTGYQNGDWNRSNAVLSDLVYNEWPVTYSDGGNVSVLNYYYAAFLIPSLVGKAFLSFRLAEIILFLWLGIGFVLVGFFLLIGLNNRKPYVFLLLAGFSGLDIIGTIINQPGMFDGSLHLDHWAMYPNKGDMIAIYQSFGTAVDFSIHHYIPTMLVAFYFAVMAKRHNYKLTGLLASSLLLWTPLAVFGLIPLVFILFPAEKLDLRKFISKADCLALGIIALPIVMYFLSMNIGNTSGGKFSIRGIEWLEHNWPIMLLFAFLEFGLLWMLVWNALKGRLNKIDKVVLVTSLATMFGYLFIDYGWAHDFSMRGTIIPWMILFMYFADSFIFADQRYKNYLLFYAVIAFLSCSTEYSRDIGETVRNKFHAVRAYWTDNTVDGTDLMYQYVGDVNAPFYRIFGARKFNTPTSKEICSEANMLISDSGNSVYFYEDYLVFNGITPDDSRQLSVNYHYPDGRVSTKDYFMSWLLYRFGSLQSSGLGGLKITDYSFKYLDVNINGKSYTITFEDFTKHAKSVSNKSHILFSKMTDANWNNGISRNGNIILIDRPSVTDRSLVGKTLEYCGEKYKVSDVRYGNSLTYVSLDRQVKKIDESINVAFIL